MYSTCYIPAGDHWFLLCFHFTLEPVHPKQALDIPPKKSLCQVTFHWSVLTPNCSAYLTWLSLSVKDFVPSWPPFLNPPHLLDFFLPHPNSPLTGVILIDDFIYHLHGLPSFLSIAQTALFLKPVSWLPTQHLCLDTQEDSSGLHI